MVSLSLWLLLQFSCSPYNFIRKDVLVARDIFTYLGIEEGHQSCLVLWFLGGHLLKIWAIFSCCLFVLWNSWLDLLKFQITLLLLTQLAVMHLSYALMMLLLSLWGLGLLVLVWLKVIRSWLSMIMSTGTQEYACGFEIMVALSSICKGCLVGMDFRSEWLLFSPILDSSLVGLVFSGWSVMISFDVVYPMKMLHLLNLFFHVF